MCRVHYGRSYRLYYVSASLSVDYRHLRAISNSLITVYARITSDPRAEDCRDDGADLRIRD